jgi:hypothetical protein
MGVWPVVIDNWPHETGHNPHTPITQNFASVVYQELTTPWGWQPYDETRRVDNLERINKSSTILR